MSKLFLKYINNEKNHQVIASDDNGRDNNQKYKRKNYSFIRYSFSASASTFNRFCYALAHFTA